MIIFQSIRNNFLDMFTVKSDFIGSFKLGDNINHNLKILSLLYKIESTCSADEKKMLQKPMIITIASICEAVLHDFHFRIRAYTKEGVRNLAVNIINGIRGKKIDEFEKYIASARKNELFGTKESKLYDDLEELRKLRNRIHIQNVKRHLEPDEILAFRHERKVLSEKTLEQVLKQLVEKYPRPPGATGFVKEFELPWEEHFTNNQI